MYTNILYTFLLVSLLLYHICCTLVIQLFYIYREYVYLDMLTTSVFLHQCIDIRIDDVLLFPDLHHLPIQLDSTFTTNSGHVNSNRFFYPKGEKSKKLKEEIADAMTYEEKNVSSELIKAYAPKFPKVTPRKPTIYPDLEKTFVMKEEQAITDPSAEALIKSLRKNEIRLKKLYNLF